MIRQINWWWHDFKQGCKNIKMFWRIIWRFKPWDYSYQLRLWQTSLVPLRDSILNGYEVTEHRMPKVIAIQEAIDLIDKIIEDEYIDQAESELDIDFLDTTNASEASKVVTYANELAQKDWERLWRIMQGQNHNEYIMLLDRNPDTKLDLWAEWFDGTDMRSWWD